ncbi:SMI1_KNR4 domain-containing protein [Tenacibaculum sp. 190524A05c]|uniref:SMI1/KNR4 family protein n=1 Tax=Tenacibaculum platacis TaxID=3137852 RepID=UPI0031FB3BEE
MNKIDIRKSETPISKEELNTFIEKYNLDLPGSYIEFILLNNGGYTSKSLFESNEDKSFIIDCFYSVRSDLGDFQSNLGRLVNIKKILENNLVDRDLPSDLFPFGDGGAGTFFCISMNQDSLGKIYKYYWDGSGLEYVCDSFKIFLDGLKTE